MNIHAQSATNTGPRDTNEDRFLVDEDLGFYAVADGMGGHQKGELAAQMALARTQDALKERLEGRNLDEADLCLAMREAIEIASKAVYDRASTDRSAAGMGTTLTAAVVREGTLVVGHVGDSRAYLVHEGKGRQLTNDHTMVGEMLRAGALTAEEARQHAYRHVLSRAVGPHPSVDVETLVLPLEPGDLLVLVTDGVCDGVLADQLAAAAPDGPQAILDAATAAGTRDNATVVIVEAGTDDGDSGEGSLREVVVGALARSVFRDLSFAQRAEMLNEGEVVVVEDGTSFITAGETIDATYLVVDGTASLVRGGQTLSELRAGDVIGALAIFREREAFASLVAEEGLTLLKITRAMIETLTQRRPWIGVKVYAAAAELASDAQERALHALVKHGGADKAPLGVGAPPWDMI